MCAEELSSLVICFHMQLLHGLVAGWEFCLRSMCLPSLMQLLGVLGKGVRSRGGDAGAETPCRVGCVSSGGALISHGACCWCPRV
jgi:hypothetical protein